MNTNTRRFWKKFGGCALVAPGVLAGVPAWGAQTVLMGQPPTTLQPAAVQDDSTNNDMNVFSPSGDNSNGALPEPLKFGPIIVRPHPYYQFLYATGLQNGTNNTERSIIQEIAPGVTVDLGRHWALDYTPTFEFYSNHAFQNTVNQSATLTGSTHYEDWLFNLSQSYDQSDSTLVETAMQTKQSTYDTEFSAQCALNGKMSEETDLSQVFNFVSGQQDSRSWSVMEWLNYQFNKRLTVGVSAGAGYVAIAPDGGGPGGNPDQMTQQMQARVQWRATDKLSLSLNAGAQELEFMDPLYADELNPTFGASIEYQPFKQTQLSLSAGRTVSSSDYSILAQTTENTTVSLNLSQRLFEKYFFNAGLAYTETDYTTTLGSIGSIIRTDNTYSFNMRVGRTFLKRGNVALTYQYSDNNSTATGFSFDSNQIGFEVGFAY